MDENEDIFMEAAKMTEKQTRTVTIKQKNEIITEKNLPVKLSHKERKTWGELKKAMDNEHAQRFNEVLNALPDREFVRVYLKAVEFFKPKIIRQTGEKQKQQDTTINIQINR